MSRDKTATEGMGGVETLYQGGKALSGEPRLAGLGVPDISVITAIFNAAEYLPDTIRSIRAQYCPNIEWIIIDGGSTDGTVELLKANEDVITCWLSEPDRGMYDAIAKGFERSRGEILCWLNAGDIFLPGALNLVSELFAQNEHINWLTGMQFAHLPEARIVNCFIPIMFSPDLIRCGAYGKKLPFIQQESTFFRRRMLASVDIERFRSFRLAGDLYLWYCFAEQFQPTVIVAGLGSFCIHDGQLSENLNLYWQEADTFLERPTLGGRLKTIFQFPLQYLPCRVKKMIAGKKMLIWKQGKEWT